MSTRLNVATTYKKQTNILNNSHKNRTKIRLLPHYRLNANDIFQYNFENKRKQRKPRRFFSRDKQKPEAQALLFRTPCTQKARSSSVGLSLATTRTEWL